MGTLTTRVKGRKVVLRQEHYDGPFTITVDRRDSDRLLRISWSRLTHPVNAMTQVMAFIESGEM